MAVCKASGMWFLVVVGAVVLVLIGIVAVRAVPLLRNRKLYDVKEVPAFLTKEECRHLIDRARPVLTESRVVLNGKFGQRDAARKSTSAYLDHDGDPVITEIKNRIATLTSTDVRQQEGIQVTHYNVGESIGPHSDALVSNGGDPGEVGDRIMTVILYLNDDFQGGATYFWKIARRIQPETGKAVVFSNMNADNRTFNPLAVHSGEAVRKGEKWLVNQWIRERPGNRAFRRAQNLTQLARPDQPRKAKPGPNRNRAHR